MIYGKFKSKTDKKFGPWDNKIYKTREGAKRALKNVSKKHSKTKKYSWGTVPGAYFKIVKK